MNHVFVFFAFLLSTINVWGQDTTATIKSKNQFFSFSLTGVYFNKLQFSDVVGFKAFSRRLPTGEFGFAYTNMLSKSNGFQLNLYTGIFPISIGYNIDTPANSIFNTGPNREDYQNLRLHSTDYLEVYSSVGVMGVKQFRISKVDRTFDFNYGLSFYKMWQDSREITFGSQIVIDENVSEEGVELLDAYVGDTTVGDFLASVRLELKTKTILRRHSISYGIVVNYSPFSTLEGWYSLQNLGIPSAGVIRQNINFVGFNVSYDLVR